MKSKRTHLNLPVILSLFACFSCTDTTHTISIGSLNLSPMVQGWGKPSVNLSVTGKTLSVAGRTFSNGLGTHADSRIDQLESCTAWSYPVKNKTGIGPGSTNLNSYEYTGY